MWGMMELPTDAQIAAYLNHRLRDIILQCQLNNMRYFAELDALINSSIERSKQAQAERDFMVAQHASR